MKRVFEQLGLRVLQRGWLSSNNIVFAAIRGNPASVIDTGYDSHSQQTIDLVSERLGADRLERIVNTHLHSDHCGGNAALQDATACEVCVPEVSFGAVRDWDESRLTFLHTGQTCRRFSAHKPLIPHDELALAGYGWSILPAPGHDDDAVMFFQRDSRVLISGDALWEDRLAIIFPEIGGLDGFTNARRVLADIERLNPAFVIPGHGAPFADVSSALRASRQRLDFFEASPERHMQYAARALTMFRMLEVRKIDEQSLLQWIVETPIFARLAAGNGGVLQRAHRTAQAVVDRLVLEGLLRRACSEIFVAGN
jgi:glyoxylase-like metal-dependent hydrolase (beta-lactamase superfamily II)